MTKIKKVVALALAFLMIFSSASVLANAWTVTVDDGFDLAIGTKFFINDGTEWVETEKVAPGDNVKARVYIGTDYYSNSSTLLFFYDKDFFTHGYNGISDLSVNPEVGAFTGKLNPAPVLTSQVNAGYIDSAFLDEYAAISVNLFMPSGSVNAMYDDSTWILEFDLTVAETATGEGDLFVKDTTVQNSTSQNKALVNVPKGPEGGTNADVWPMWRWNANVTLTSQPVSADGTVTFNANNGKFADGKDKVVVNGIISKEYEVPANPTRDGYTFIGWIDATDTTPTYEEAKATVLVEAIPYEPVAYNAFWIKNVNITFDTDGGSDIPARENVTPYTEFAPVAAPTKDGYTFVGWDVRGNMTLPETYPDVNTTYTAIWAKDVIVSFNTNGAAAIESIEGVAGEAFEAVIANPSKEGHRFVKWSPALPTVFPEADTTYKAIFEANIYPVYYHVDGVRVLNTLVEYGMEIPTSIGTEVPEGMTLSAWYTDEEMTQEFTAGTVMGTAPVSLYAKYENQTYNAIFDANGGKFADGTDVITTPTVYLDDIVLPANPTKAGYEFAGWTPFSAGGVFDEANDMYFYATWVEVERNVEFYAEGYGENGIYEVFDLNTGDEFEIPADPYKEGYSFLYWSETEGGAEAQLPATMPELESAEPLKYYAVFEINEYTITWDVDGVTSEATYKYDEKIVAVDDPTKEGYSFAGWDGYTDGMKMPADDITAKATWAIETYTLKFDTVGGNEIGDITAEFGAKITVPNDPTKEGHTFTGWNKEIYTTMPDLGDNGATETFTASWKVNDYTVTWIVDGEEDVDTYAYGADITAPAPTKTGYVFAGWDGEVPETMPANNLTFTGSWNPATDTKYTVNIHTMGTDGQYTVESEELKGTTDSTVNAVYTVEEGFELGANSKTEGTVAADGSLVLDVYLNRKTITISFNTDGGTAVNAVSGLYGADVADVTEPTKKGHKFEGWDSLPETFPAADTEVKAIWSAVAYDATFNAAGGQFGDGSAETKVSTVFGKEIVAPAAPTMKGHKFEGWTPEVGNMTEEGMSFTAVWTPVEYNAVFDANGGKFTDGSSTATVLTTFGEAIVAPEDPTMDGYVFSTWTPAVGDMTEEGMTFTAQWINATDTKYTVTVYTMNTDGTYGEGVTSTYAGETGTEATAEGKYTIGEGFKLSDVKENKLTGTIAADGSLALVVYIDRIEYTFTVDVDGTKTTENYLFGATVATPETPVKDGYTFKAWNPGVPATMPAENVEVVAEWTANTNTAFKVVVNYTDAQTGEAVATEKNYTGTTAYAIEIVETAGSAENTKYVLFSDLIPRHYQLNTSAANELTGTIAADGSTVLNVYLIPVKYTATFTTGDGAFADGSKSYEAELDYYSVAGDYAPAEEPTREGYSFGGWRNADAHITGDREFAAIWNIESYTIILDADGGTVTPESITAAYGAPINPVADPVKEGHKFEGWSDVIPATMPDLGANGATKTITATWSKLSYTVTWVVPEQENQVDTVVYGDAITAPVPTRTGYVFAGWDAEVPETMPAENLTFNGSWNPATDTKYTVNIHTMGTDGQYTVESKELKGTTDSTVNAVYTVETGFELGANSKTEGTVAADGSLVLDVYLNRKTVTISFNTDGGTAVDALTGLYGAAVGTPATTTKTGYTFAGWDSLPATFPAADTTVKALWNINSYVITFNAGEGTFADGSKEKTAEFDYNTMPVAPETPAKVGYGFTGWSPEFAPVTGAATYTAQFAAGAVSYTVETYTMDTEGNYGTPATETKGGTADTTATVVPVEKTGFTISGDSVLEGTIAADGSLVLKVYYIRNQYDFTVTVDDESTTTKYYYEATIAAPAEPSKEGHTFAGWDKEVPATMPAENYEVKATWTVDNFTITWIVDGEEDVDTYAYGADITAPVPTKTGYVFAGWDGEVPETMPANNLTFTGSWNPATDTKYTVNIHTMGTDGQYTVESEELKGTTDSTVNAVYTVEEGFELGANSKTEGTVAADGSLVLDVYLNRKTVTISFNTDGGTAVEALTGLYGAAVGTPAETTKEGHEFAGWDSLPATFPAADTTVTAQWTLLSYELIYRTNAGVYETFEVPFGATEIPAPAVDPEWTGHTFKGWLDVPETMPAKKVTATADWTIESYTIKFNTDGGSAVADITAEYNAAVTVPAAPTKAGYVFNGWVDAEGNSVTVSNKMPDLGDDGAVVTYKATWANADDTAYTVEIYTMNANGEYDATSATKYGTTGATVTAEYTVEEGFELSTKNTNVLEGTIAADGSTVLKVYLDRKSYTLTVNVDDATTTSTVLYGAAISVADPSKEGHEFAGWTPALPATMPAEDVEVTATWTVNNYTVTWIVDGEEKTETYAYGATITAPTYTKDGYVFAGWDNTIPATMPAENLTFTGSWVNATDTKYTVTIKTMNTEGGYDEVTNTYTGETGALVKADYTIEEGFSLNAASVTEGNILADSSLALVVIIDRNEYKFTVVVDDETTETKYLFGATVAAPAAPSKEGHSFAGWDGEVPATMPAKDVTVKATWTVDNFTVTWVVDGEEDVDTYAYGAAITAPVPTKTGYVFAGWDGEVPATMPANNLTFNGSWNPATDTKYTVNIHTMGLDGQYTVKSEELEGTTDSTVSAVYTVETGFELGANSKTEGTVAADGSLVLDVYLNRKTVTITFADTGDEAIAPIVGLYGTVVEAPEDPVKEGHTFTGWDKPVPATLAENTTITATWNVNSYTVTWVVDGEAKDIVGYKFGAPVAGFEAPSKDGYVFAGWAWTNDKGETVAAPETMPAYNVTATATWANATDTAYTVEIYTMKVDGEYEVTSTTKYGETGADVTAEYTVEEGFELSTKNTSVLEGKIAADGSTVLKVYLDRKSYTITVNGKEDEYLYGEEIPVPEITEIPEGYEQDKENPWVDENGDPIELPITVGTDNPSEIKPNWSILSYELTFVVDGVEDTKTLDYGAAIEAPKPLKEGYRFVGWADETGAIATVPAKMPAKDLKFIAVYETSTYIVNYYVDGVLVETYSVEYGSAIATEITSYKVPVGYTLSDWYTDEACENKLAEGATVGAASTKLYAKTSAKTYDAIFMVDGEVYDTVPTVFDTEIIAPAEVPTKEGFVFAGWTPELGLMDTEGKTFTATWKEVTYTVTYKAEGMKDEAFDLTFGEELDVPADPYKEGYTFKHWSLTEGGEAATLPATMPAENLVYYAVFEVNEYTVTWVIDGAETVDTVAYGAAITAPEASKDGFEFKGWSLTADGELVTPATVMGAENLKYYAVFEAAAAELPIKLMPYDSETGVIERNIDGEQFIESYNDDSADPEFVYDNFDEDYEQYYVYGFTGRSFDEEDVWDYFYVQGNGSMELEYSELTDEYGTGAKIIVTDNETGDIVEEFYVIIFGDVNGDAVIDTADSSEVKQELITRTWSSGRRGVKYRIKAADLDLTEEIDTNDSAALKSRLINTVKIDQTTGSVVLK